MRDKSKERGGIAWGDTGRKSTQRKEREREGIAWGDRERKRKRRHSVVKQTERDDA